MSKIFLKIIDMNGKEIFLPIQNMFVENEDGTMQIISVEDVKDVEFEDNAGY